MGCGGSKDAPAQSTRTTTRAPKEEEQAAKVEVETPKTNDNTQESASKEQTTTEQTEEPASVPPPDSAVTSEKNETSEDGFTEFELHELEQHNAFRAKHGTGPMKLNKELCQLAQEYANHLAATASFEHAKDRQYKGQSMGENLYMSASSQPDASAEGSTKSWYDEIKDYDYDNPGFSMNTGHFTQVVWQGSTELGIAFARYEADNWHNTVVVGRYFPAGNMQGAFEENVLKISEKLPMRAHLRMRNTDIL